MLRDPTTDQLLLLLLPLLLLPLRCPAGAVLSERLPQAFSPADRCSNGRRIGHSGDGGCKDPGNDSGGSGC